MKTQLIRSFIALATASTLAGTALAADATWLTDYEKALAQAKAENKAVLLDFTGTDWCGWCIKMVKDTLSQKEFTEYAAKNLVLVEVDFPNKKEQTEELKKQNAELKKKFDAKGFPTFVLLDKDGKELGRQRGYLEGGPAAFIAKLDGFKAGAK
jgi:protein disulfide-isomerase